MQALVANKVERDRLLLEVVRWGRAQMSGQPCRRHNQLEHAVALYFVVDERLQCRSAASRSAAPSWERTHSGASFARLLLSARRREQKGCTVCRAFSGSNSSSNNNTSIQSSEPNLQASEVPAMTAYAA